MRVVATAGHVDHGKSTLVRALTGQDPDRLPDERRRGMTVDLGFASFRLPSGDDLAIVDVPGHHRYLANSLGGIATAPAVLFAVAADGGWEPQSGEHLAAARAFGITRGVLAVTRSDLADPAPVIDLATARLRDAGIDAEAVAVSARTGLGIDRLVTTLDAATAGHVEDGPVRLWIDRVFTRPGAGTVVTGTLRGGTIRVGDRLWLAPRRVAADVRGLHSLGRAVDTATGPARVAVNLRRVAVDAVARGDALVEGSRWRVTDLVDVEVPEACGDLPRELLVHHGTAMTAARTRRLDARRHRLRLASPLPFRHGDRLLLNDTGPRRLLAARIADADPPPLRRRGDATAWAVRLAETPRPEDLLRRRGIARIADLLSVGCPIPTDAVAAGDHVVDPDHAVALGERLAALVGESRRPIAEAARVLDVPGAVIEAVSPPAGLIVDGGFVARSGLPEAARAVLDTITDDLRGAPFAAPTATRLTEIGATRDILAILVRAGALWHGGGPVHLAADAPDRAAEVLRGLTGPFTVGEAARALGTTRRVATPLLEHLHRTGRTRRTGDGRHAIVTRRPL